MGREGHLAVWAGKCTRPALLLIVALFISLPAIAQAAGSVLWLDGSAPFHVLESHLDLLEDQTGSLTIDSVARHGEFLPARQRGIAPGTLWYRFTVARARGVPAQWVLAFGEPDIDDARLFQPMAGGGFTEIRAGRRIPSQDLALAARRHVMALELPEGEPTTFYLRLASDRKIRFEEAALWRPEPLMFEETRQTASYGIHFGILTTVAIIAALFGLWLRDWAMLAYSAYVGTVVVRGISHTGIIALLFPTLGGTTNDLLIGFGLLGGAITFVVMWDRILDLRLNFPAMHRFYLATAAMVTASLVTIPSPTFHLAAQGAHMVMLGASFGSLAMAALLLRREPRNVLLRFYLLAFFPFVLVWGAEIAAFLSPMVPPHLGRQFYQMATPIHIITLSVALAYRLRQMQRERLKAEVSLAGEQVARQRLRTFVDMATHEFKTPLAVIDSAAQMIGFQAPPERPEITSRIVIIRRAVQRLVNLVETCLAGERSETLTLTLQTMAPAKLVEQVIERNQQPEASPLATRIGDVPGNYVADPDLLGIALDALIDNARRYGPSDQPVTIALHGDDDCLTFMVEDRGPGIAQEEVGRVFDKYYRCAASDALPGTGIGLHLVKTIAELHGGQAAYRPREGGGASFLLTIPGGYHPAGQTV